MFSLKLELGCGESLEDACKEAVRISDMMDITVYFFWEKDYQVVACPGHNPKIMAEETRKMKESVEEQFKNLKKACKNAD